MFTIASISIHSRNTAAQITSQLTALMEDLDGPLVMERSGEGFQIRLLDPKPAGCLARLLVFFLPGGGPELSTTATVRPLEEGSVITLKNRPRLMSAANIVFAALIGISITGYAVSKPLLWLLPLAALPLALAAGLVFLLRLQARGVVDALDNLLSK